MIRLYISIAIVLSLAAAGYGVKYYYDDTQERLAKQATQLSTYQSANDQMSSTIDRMQNDIAVQRQANADLELALSVAEEYGNDLQQKLTDHDLTKLSIAKPGLIETRINDATEKLFADLELSTSTD